MKRPHSTHANTPLRQRQILQAALACFSEKGMVETSIADICEKANASIGSVYHHFKSKEKLAAAVYLEGIRDYQAGLVETLEAKKSARAGIHAVIHYHLKWVESNRDWSVFLFQKRYAAFMGETEEGIKALNTRFAKRISIWFAKHSQGGALRKLPPDIFICLLLGACQEYSRLYISGSAFTDLDDAANSIAAAVWRSLGVKD